MKLLILISVGSFEMTVIDRSNSLSGEGRDKNKNLVNVLGPLTRKRTPN